MARWLILAILLLTGAAHAAPPDVYTLDDLLRLADENNPGIVAAARAVEAAEGRLVTARLYPNPAIAATQEDMPTDGIQADKGKSSVALEQPIVIGNRRRAAANAGRAEIAALKAALESERHAVWGELHQFLVEMLYLERAFQLQWSLVEDAEADAAAVPEQDRPRMEFEVQRLRTGLLTTVTRRSVVELEIRRLVGGIVVPRNRLRGALIEKLDGRELAISTEDTVAEHPDTMAAQSRIEQDRRGIDLARAEIVPDITIRAGATYDQREDDTMAMVGVSIPIPLWNRNQGRIREARANVAIREAERDTVEQYLSARIDTLLQLLNELDTLAQDYATTLVPMAEHAHTAARDAVAAGGGTALELLDAQRTRSEARSEALRYRYELNRSLAELRHLRRYAPPPQ